MHDPGLSSDGNSISDFQVASDADLPSEDNVVAQLRAARNARLGNDEAVFPDNDVVPDLHQVVYFGSLADDSRPERAAINGHVRADFDVVAKDDLADLRHLAVNAPIENVAEAIRADDAA